MIVPGVLILEHLIGYRISNLNSDLSAGCLRCVDYVYLYRYNTLGAVVEGNLNINVLRSNLRGINRSINWLDRQ